MSYRLVFEFENEEDRDEFLGGFSDGGGEDTIYMGFEARGRAVTFDYKRAFKTWGWDGVVAHDRLHRFS